MTFDGNFMDEKKKKKCKSASSDTPGQGEESKKSCRLGLQGLTQHPPSL